MTNDTQPTSAPIRFILLLCLAGACLFWLGWQLQHRASEPQRIRWQDHKGTWLFATSSPHATHPIRGCHGDTRLQLLVHGTRVWGLCPSGLFTPSHTTRYKAGTLVQFHPARRLAFARWPLPLAYRLTHTIAALPHANGQLAFLYRANHKEGHLVLGIAGPKGWVHPPKPLFSREGGRVLGLSWQRQRLQVLLAPATATDPTARHTPLTLLTIGHKRTHTIHRPCHNQPRCHVHAAYFHKTWKLLLEWHPSTTHKPTAKPTSVPSSQPASAPTRRPLASGFTKEGIWIVGLSSATWRFVPAWQPYHFMLRERIDLTLAGLLPSRPTLLAKRLLATGQLVSLGQPARFNQQLRRHGGQYLFHHNRLWLRDRWSLPNHDITHRLPSDKEGIRLSRQRRKEVHPIKGTNRHVHIEDALSLKRLDAYEVTTQRDIARSPSPICLDPLRMMLVPTPNNAQHWLLHPSGCLLTLDRKWQRIQPTPLSTTYNQHHIRSLLHRARIKRQFVALLWSLIGFPALMILAWPLQIIYKKRQRQAKNSQYEPYLFYTYAVTLYLVSALWWWPILRDFF